MRRLLSVTSSKRVFLNASPKRWMGRREPGPSRRQAPGPARPPRAASSGRPGPRASPAPRRCARRGSRRADPAVSSRTILSGALTTAAAPAKNPRSRPSSRRLETVRLIGRSRGGGRSRTWTGVLGAEPVDLVLKRSDPSPGPFEELEVGSHRLGLPLPGLLSDPAELVLEARESRRSASASPRPRPSPSAPSAPDRLLQHGDEIGVLLRRGRGGVGLEDLLPHPQVFLERDAGLGGAS